MKQLTLILIGVAALSYVGKACAQNSAVPDPLPVFLLTQKAVQKDVKLSEKQIVQMKAAYAKREQAITALKKLDKKNRLKKFREISQQLQKDLQAMLEAEQKKRLRQIQWQQRGPGVAGRALKFTLAQQRKVVEIYRSMRKKSAEISKKNKGNPKAVANATAKLRKEVDGQIMQIMTDTQKANWKKMIGKTFQGK